MFIRVKTISTEERMIAFTRASLCHWRVMAQTQEPDVYLMNTAFFYFIFSGNSNFCLDSL